ncbi:MAG: HAD family hydrolase, partial [Dehalococcoidia bacterium]|nr:HAD family hydrolase [Dehalococcoidia bacterium]
SRMEHTLYAVDELSGFIRAVALVRPSKSLDDVSPRSVRRKMKDKAFAKDVSRDDIVRGAEELNIDLDEHIAFIVESMKPIATQIDLAGGDAAS